MDDGLDIYLEYVFPAGLFQQSLKQHGFLNVDMTPDLDQPFTYEVKMRRENHQLDAAGARQQIRDIVAAIPASERRGVVWRVELCVAVVEGATVAAALKLGYIEPGMRA